MQKFGKKYILICIVIALVTFLSSSVFYIALGAMCYKHIILTDEGSQVLTEVKSVIDALYLEPYESEALYQSAAKGMTDALDDYTAYYTPKEFMMLVENARGTYVGVGLVLTQTEDGKIMVLQTYENAPGAQAGVRAGDIVLRINGAPCEDLDAAANALRGDGSKAQGEGSQVEAVFLREDKEYSVTITRREIHLTTVSARMEEDGVGYFKIIGFDEDTDVEFKTQYELLAPQGMRSMVIDLRDNGGGDYYTVCRLAGMFLEEGETVVYRQEKSGERVYEYAEGHCIDMPVIILANENSASASEVLIGALRGNQRLKKLVGTKTFGKGVTQDVLSLRSGGGMTVTVSRYYTPDDVCIHGVGFTPDVVVESGYEKDYPVEAIERDKDVQLKKALEIAVQ